MFFFENCLSDDTDQFICTMVLYLNVYLNNPKRTIKILGIQITCQLNGHYFEYGL